MQSTDSAPHNSNMIHSECRLSMHHGVSAYVCSAVNFRPTYDKKSEGTCRLTPVYLKKKKYLVYFVDLVTVICNLKYFYFYTEVVLPALL